MSRLINPDLVNKKNAIPFEFLFINFIKFTALAQLSRLVKSITTYRPCLVLV